MIDPMLTNTTTPAKESRADTAAVTDVVALCGGSPIRG